MRVFITTILLLLPLVATSGTFSDGVYFQIMAKVLETPYDDMPNTSVGIILKERTNGRISFVFYRDPHSIEAKSAWYQLPVQDYLHFNKPEDINRTEMIVDLILMPYWGKNGSAFVEGIVCRWVNENPGGIPSFKYYEDKMDYETEDGYRGKVTIPFKDGNNIVIRLNLQHIGQSADDLPEQTDVSFDAQYSLFNSSSKEYLIKDDSCRLVYSHDSNKHKGCRHAYMFRNGDDSILYISDYEVEYARKDDYSLTTFNFQISRYYAVNPTFGSKNSSESQYGSIRDIRESSLRIDPDKFGAESVMTTSFTKTITSKPGEWTVIEIPSDESSPIKSATEEKITLRSIEDYIPIDEPPQMIYQEVPVYPSKAFKENVEGVVWIKAFVNKEGEVKNAYTIKCDKPKWGFEESAVNAAYKNQFKPATKNGKPVAIWITYSVQFSLSDK